MFSAQRQLKPTRRSAPLCAWQIHRAGASAPVSSPISISATKGSGREKAAGSSQLPAQRLAQLEERRTRSEPFIQNALFTRSHHLANKLVRHYQKVVPSLFYSQPPLHPTLALPALSVESQEPFLALISVTKKKNIIGTWKHSLGTEFPFFFLSLSHRGRRGAAHTATRRGNNRVLRDH